MKDNDAVWEAANWNLPPLPGFAPVTRSVKRAPESTKPTTATPIKRAKTNAQALGSGTRGPEDEVVQVEEVAAVATGKTSGVGSGEVTAGDVNMGDESAGS